MHECSYVLKGAGVGTQLVAMKAEQRYRQEQLIKKIEGHLAERQREEQRQAEALYQRFLARERKLHR